MLSKKMDEAITQLNRTNQPKEALTSVLGKDPSQEIVLYKINMGYLEP